MSCRFGGERGWRVTRTGYELEIINELTTGKKKGRHALRLVGSDVIQRKSREVMCARKRYLSTVCNDSIRMSRLNARKCRGRTRFSETMKEQSVQVRASKEMYLHAVERARGLTQCEMIK